jgi:hypothetical protein
MNLKLYTKTFVNSSLIMDPYVWSQASLDQLQYEVASQDDISPLWVHTTDNDSWGWGEMGSEDVCAKITI